MAGQLLSKAELNLIEDATIMRRWEARTRRAAGRALARYLAGRASVEPWVRAELRLSAARRELWAVEARLLATWRARPAELEE